MKKLLFILIISIPVFTFQSCDKHEKDSTETLTVNGTIQMNETYTYTLPANTTKEPYRITEQPTHAGTTQLYKSATGETVYQYVPSKDYAGTDKVMISNEGSGSKGKHHGMCNDDDKNKSRRVTINLSVVNPEGKK